MINAFLISYEENGKWNDFLGFVRCVCYLSRSKDGISLVNNDK